MPRGIHARLAVMGTTERPKVGTFHRPVKMLITSGAFSLVDKDSHAYGCNWNKGGESGGKVFSSLMVGIDEKIIREYVEMQGEEDEGQAKLEF